jgi:hypothetical protein
VEGKGVIWKVPLWKNNENLDQEYTRYCLASFLFILVYFFSRGLQKNNADPKKSHDGAVAPDHLRGPQTRGAPWEKSHSVICPVHSWADATLSRL